MGQVARPIAVPVNSTALSDSPARSCDRTSSDVVASTSSWSASSASTAGSASTTSPAGNARSAQFATGPAGTLPAGTPSSARRPRPDHSMISARYAGEPFCRAAASTAASRSRLRTPGSLAAASSPPFSCAAVARRSRNGVETDQPLSSRRSERLRVIAAASLTSSSLGVMGAMSTLARCPGRLGSGNRCTQGAQPAAARAIRR
jgi:hypothetical protein